MSDGKKMSGKRFLAQAMWELATSGKVTMPNGATWVVDPRDWIETAKWLYVHIDGPAKQQVDVTSNDERIGGDLTDEQRLAAIVAAFSAIGSGLPARADDSPPVVDAAVRSTS